MKKLNRSLEQVTVYFSVRSYKHLSVSYVSEGLSRQHFVEHHERVLGRQQTAEGLVLPAAPLTVRDLLHCELLKHVRRQSSQAASYHVTRDRAT